MVKIFFCDLNTKIKFKVIFNVSLLVLIFSGVIPSEGHYGENSVEENGKLLGVGFLARYAEDLPLLMSVLGAEKKALLKLDEPVC